MRTVPLNCGMSKFDRRLAVGVELHRAGEEGDQLFGRRAAFRGECCRAVAAGAQPPGDAERAVDQAAVEVAQFEPELALAEEPGLRIRSLVVGQVEDAEIDGRDHDIGVAAGRCACHRNRNGKRRARRRFLGRCGRHLELLFARIDLQPFHADGAGRHARFLRFAGPVERGGDIGAGAPVGPDRNLDHRAVRGDGRGDGGEQPVGADGHQKFAVEERRDLQLGDFARRVGLLVERDFEPVRRVGRACRRRTSRRRTRRSSPGRPDRAFRFRAGSGPSRPAAISRLRCRRRCRSCRWRPPRWWSPARSSSSCRCGTTGSSARA